MVRKIRGLRWARELAKRPEAIPIGRPRGVKALGVRYERAFGKELALAEHGKWFEFEDDNGHGYAQPDFLLRGPTYGMTLILETKYTWTPAGHEQMEWLYVPLVEATRGGQVRTCQVCKVLTERARGVVTIHEDLLSVFADKKSRKNVLQWLPGTTIGVKYGKVDKRREEEAAKQLVW